MLILGINIDQTELWYASYNGCIEIVKVLLEAEEKRKIESENRIEDMNERFQFMKSKLNDILTLHYMIV